MSLAPYIHAMGRGPARARSLTRGEASDAMSQILTGSAAPEAVGALLMLMRYRGETAAEIAGFTDAARLGSASWGKVDADLDWPSYAAGRSRGLPWFLLSAKLVAAAGYRVLVHGWNSHQSVLSNVPAAVRMLGIPTVDGPTHVRAMLDRHGIAYAPLGAVNAALLEVLCLRDVLGLRSAVNTVCRMLNPAGADSSIQGVFHPSYRNLQQDAGKLLGQPRLMAIKGGGGEFERNPAKPCIVHSLVDDALFQTSTPALVDGHLRLADASRDRRQLSDIWSGARQDPYAEAIVTGTTALALMALHQDLSHSSAQSKAMTLWQARHCQRAA